MVFNFNGFYFCVFLFHLGVLGNNIPKRMKGGNLYTLNMEKIVFFFNDPFVCECIYFKYLRKFTVNLFIFLA